MPCPLNTSSGDFIETYTNLYLQSKRRSRNSSTQTWDTESRRHSQWWMCEKILPHESVFDVVMKKRHFSSTFLKQPMGLPSSTMLSYNLSLRKSWNFRPDILPSIVSLWCWVCCSWPRTLVCWDHPTFLMSEMTENSAYIIDFLGENASPI